VLLLRAPVVSCAQIQRIECPSLSAARTHRQYKVRVQRASVARAAAELV
jgi:ribosomal protein S30